MSAAPKRRLPFKPTALQRLSAPTPESKDKDGDAEDDGLSLFQRSKEFFPVALAEQERRRKRKHSKRESSRNDRSSSTAEVKDGVDKVKVEDEESPLPRPTSRNQSQSQSQSQGQNSQPTVAVESTDDNDGDGLGATIATPPSKRSRTSHGSINSNPLHPTSPCHARHPKSPARSRRSVSTRSPSKLQDKGKQPEFVDLEDESYHGQGASLDDPDEDIYGATPIRYVKSTRSSSAAHDLEDPFVVEEEEDKKDDALREEEEEDDDDEVNGEFAEFIRAAQERQKKAEEAEKDKTRIQLLVTSRLPDTEPKRFVITLWKPLSAVRRAWCLSTGATLRLGRQTLEGTFLTWRGRRLYDSTTIDSLDIRASASGTLQHASVGKFHDTDGFSKDWTRLHMEIWTEELWEEHQKRMERERRRALGELYDDSDDGGAALDGENDGEGAPAPAPEEQKIRVILKTRSDEPVKTTVRPSTTIQTLVVMYRKMRNVPEGSSVSLYFDGEQLDEASTIEEVDIEDMDTIEVSVKD
ncbi:hypothetical protein SODALDRAFT_353234 [Sodiomyces alkalinus F11]|uniref:Ubiquitin-like domain-containing protein n=1 Tax=Sodiomyces alkalinus (strain CBS 110278 / VKM F-3762 / F11) TaxID=1314773 RepID=A0A3N2PMD4_SODAK|nr:hypothetical protein SODALDRAFT_353234 [Sodiomyces alkalinus F11]ROT35580.1 hypothetical protein SODALDRAFT_353234 [Sodiomyces alkalinus F11]